MAKSYYQKSFEQKHVKDIQILQKKKNKRGVKRPKISKSFWRRKKSVSITVKVIRLFLRKKSKSKFSISDSNLIRTHNHVVRERTLNYLAKLTEWLSCVVSTYLYGAFDCMLLSCHVRVPEWIHTLYFAWMSRNSFVEASTIFEV